MKKLKVLVYADAGNHTGFERVMRGIMTYLHNTGEFDIRVMGIGYHGSPEFDYPFKVYPASLNAEDLLGVHGIGDAILVHKPDVVWILQDMWNITSYLSHAQALHVPVVTYSPIDTPNLKWSYAMSCGAASQPVAYTEYGAREIAAGVRAGIDLLYSSAKKAEMDTTKVRAWLSMPHPSGTKLHMRLDRLARFQNPESIAVVPHGFEHAAFEVRDKLECRKLFGLPADAFIVGNVNTNQFRKRQDSTMRAFAPLAYQNPNAILLLHCARFTIQGWDLEQLAAYLGIADQVFFVHEHVPELPDDALPDLYNTLDVQINTAGGEGWGLTSFEGAACGVPQLVPDWSATRELWKDHGVLLPVSDVRFEPKYLNTAHAIVDVKAAADKLLLLHDFPQLREMYSKLSLELAAKQWSWDRVGAEFAKVIMAAIAEPEAALLSLDDMMNTRVGALASEMAGVVYLQYGKPVHANEF